MALSATDRVLRVQGPLYTPIVSTVVQVNLVVCSILRAMLYLLPQFNFAFTVAIFLIETCLIDILVVAIGVCTAVICTLAYYSFITLIWCMSGIVNRIGLRQVARSFIPGRQCGIGRYFSIVVILLFMVPVSLLYTCWHFSFVRKIWLHEFVVEIQVLHLLPTSLMILTTLGQGVFLAGVIISTNPLRSMALTHGGKVKEHVRAFAGLNLALLLYSASAIIIAYRQGVNEIDRISRLVWVMEIVFRLLSVAVAVYVERSIGHQNLPPLGRGEQAGGQVELEDREPLNGEEVASDEAQDEKEKVSLSSEPSGTGQHAGGGVEDHEPLNGEEVASDEAQDEKENVSLSSEPSGTGQHAGGGVEDHEPLNGEEVASDDVQDQSMNVSLSSEPSGTGQHAGGGVEDHEPLNGEEVASDEAPVVCLDSRVQRENVSQPSQMSASAPQKCQAEQAMLQSVNSEPFIPVPNSVYMEFPIPISRPVDKPFSAPYGEEFYIPGSHVAQETNRDSDPNELVTLRPS